MRAVAVAIKRFCARLAKAVDAEGRPHPVLQGFARHLREHLLIPSGRGGVLYLRAADGGRLDRNIQHPTSNIQHPVKDEGGCDSSYRVCGPIQGEVTN